MPNFYTYIFSQQFLNFWNLIGSRTCNLMGSMEPFRPLLMVPEDFLKQGSQFLLGLAISLIPKGHVQCPLAQLWVHTPVFQSYSLGFQWNRWQSLLHHAEKILNVKFILVVSHSKKVSSITGFVLFVKTHLQFWPHWLNYARFLFPHKIHNTCLFQVIRQRLKT